MKKINLKTLITTILLVIVVTVTACKKAERPPFLPPPEEASEPEVGWDVQTDFSVLTPFIPQHTMHTRLNDGAMSELIPSNNYGMLLPYSSSTVLADESLRSQKFGLVTIDGIIVTDLIYDGIERAEYLHNWYVGAANDKLPAYKLFIHERDPEEAWDYYNERKMAACALDGSWVTGFDYVDIIFTKDVIILYRDDLTFDVDVINYNGEHLYNMLDFAWAKDIQVDTWPGALMDIIDDRYAHARIKNNSYVFIDLLTGGTRTTRFIAADPFIEGHAPVGVGIPGTYYVIWGLINTDFQAVVSPRYYSMPFFKYGRAIVQRRDDSQYVINTKGEVLFEVPDDYWLDHSYAGPTFIMYSKTGADAFPTYLSSEFEVILPPEETGLLYFPHLQYHNNGWYTTGEGDGIFLIKEDEVYHFPEVESISFADGDFIIYSKRDADDPESYSSSGVMTVDGIELIAPEYNALIYAVTQNDVTIAFIVSTGFSWRSISQERNPSTYKLFDTTGNIIIQGDGVLMYYEYLELFSIQGEHHFSWLDKEANPIITIPLLSSTMD